MSVSIAKLVNGSTVDFFEWDGPLRFRLEPRYRNVRQSGSTGGLMVKLDTLATVYEATVMGAGADQNNAGGIYNGLLALVGLAGGSLWVMGFETTGIKLLDVVYQEPRGGSRHNPTTLGPRSATQEYCTIKFVKES